MKEEELFAALRLQAVPNVGAQTARKLIRRFGSPAAIFQEGLRELRKQRGIGPRISREIAAPEYARAAERELNALRKRAVGYWYFEEDNYPDLLKHCPDGPIILFHKGNITFGTGPVLSVVGTRKMTAYGRDACRELIRGLTHLNPILVSGLAYGVDICAHRAALQCGMQTVACLAHGINCVYPRSHTKTLHEILECGGVITEFWNHVPPERENFLKRNRIIAGLSEATVVIESGEKGGSLITADLALSYHREVFAFPGSINQEQSKGCNALIRDQKAQLITSPEELIRFMNWQAETRKMEGVQLPLFSELDGVEKLVWEQLQEDGRQLLDTLALRTSLPVSRISSTLLSLEMKGLVRPLPGKYFEPCKPTTWSGKRSD